MTKEQAIEVLNTYYRGEDNDDREFCSAIDMAIKALEQEPCEDAVSRQAVLDTLDKMDSVLDEDRTVETYKELLVACYNDLPSVTPAHKKGKWIRHYCNNGNLHHIECSNCHDWHENFLEHKYCPNCGAEMESEE